MAAQYKVVFSGDLRAGYEAQAVIESLAKQFKLPLKKVAHLINGKAHTIKLTSSLEEAKRYALILARSGAIAQIKQIGSATTTGREAAPAANLPQVERRNKKRDKPTGAKGETVADVKPIPEFHPLKMRWLFKPLSLIVAAVDIVFTLFYMLALILLFIVLIHQAFFSSWLTELIPLPVVPTIVGLFVLAAGSIILFIYGKPILSLLSTPPHTVPLLEQEEPDIYTFVEYLCESINAPMPQSILLTNDAEVHMVYIGLGGFFSGKVNLQMGLSLVAGLTTTQFTAAITQAAAPFSRKSAPRLQHIIRSVNDWLHRATHVDDIFDTKLKRRHANRADALSGLLIELSIASRKMARLFVFGHRILMKRLIQYSIANADQQACQVAGNSDFRHFVQQSRVLVFATQKILPGLRREWDKSGTLPDNIAFNIVTRSADYPEDIHERLRKAQEKKKAESQDIIPSDNQRFRHADTTIERGWCKCESPASSIFHHFEKISHNMTVRYYHNYLNIPVTSNKLVRSFIAGSEEFEANQIIGTYFNKLFVDLLPLKINASLAEYDGLDQESLLAHWRSATQQIIANKNSIKVASANLLEADDKLIELGNKEVLFRANIDKSLAMIVAFKDGSAESIAQNCRDAEHEYAQAEKSLTGELASYSQRLASTLALLQHPVTQDKISSAGKLHAEVTRLLATFDRIEALYPQLHNLRLHSFYIEGLLSREARGKKQKWIDRVDEQQSDIQELLTSIGIPVKSIPYPFQGSKFTKLRQYIESDASRVDSPFGSFDRSYETLNKLTRIQQLILGRLTKISMLIEEHIS